MLSEQQRALIKATIPLLESGGEALTTHFYRMMFRDYPQVRALFNQTHQATGDQPRALANSVLMYARYIDTPEVLAPAVARIVNKHVALQVLPEHYAIVGTCLLRSMREVLGAEIATDAILEAWGAAYQQLADLLIQAEGDLYLSNAQAKGGWSGVRAFRLERKVQETAEISSFYLLPEDGQPVLQAKPGQYLGIRVVLEGEELRRNYSLSADSQGEGYRITLKRQGRVSQYLHDQLQLGERLEVFPPAGDFYLEPSERPLVLISAGTGITPIIAMLERALKVGGRSICLIHCDRRPETQAFGQWLQQQAAAHPQFHYYSCYEEGAVVGSQQASGRLTAAFLEQCLPPERAQIEAYYLGPLPFMKQVRAWLAAAGVPASQSHCEFFGPMANLDA